MSADADNQAPEKPFYIIAVKGRPETLTIDDVKDRLELDELSYDTLACRPGGGAWKPLYSFPELHISPPLPGEELNEFPITMLSLAFVPGLIGALTGIDVPWIAYAIYNTAFMIWDMNILTRAGYKDKKILWVLGFTIIPLYLFGRARMVHRWRWFWIWIVSALGHGYVVEICRQTLESFR